MAQPILAYTNTYSATTAMSASGYFTFSFAITAGFEAWVPVKILYPGTNAISAGAEVYAFRSTDGGATFEGSSAGWNGVGTFSAVFPRPTLTNGQIDRLDINLPTGQYLVAVQVGGGGVASTYSVEFALTAVVVTAYS